MLCAVWGDWLTASWSAFDWTGFSTIFTQSGSMFVFTNSYWENVIGILAENIPHFRKIFITIYLLDTAHLILRSNSKK